MDGWVVGASLAQLTTIPKQGYSTELRGTFFWCFDRKVKKKGGGGLKWSFWVVSSCFQKDLFITFGFGFAK
jgi:hypothetical protein